MKKMTILAVSLVLAAAFLAVWLGRERPGSDQSSSPAAEIRDPPAPSNLENNTVSSASGTDHDRLEPSSESVAPPTLPSTEPVKLFSRPDYGSDEYRQALDDTTVRMAARTDVQSVQLLKRNEAGFDELIRQLDTNPDGLSARFEVSPSEVRPCTISFFDRERVSPEFTPGVSVPDKYSLVAYCDEPPGYEVSVMVDRALQGTVSVTVRSATFGGLSIYAIDDSGYSVAIQGYPPHLRDQIRAAQ